MKTSDGFFYTFNHEEIQKGVFMTGKYSVTYDHEDNQVYGIRVNTGLDFPQDFTNVHLDLPNRGSKLFEACKNHLEDL